MALWLDKVAKPSPTNEAPNRREQRRNDLLVAAVVIFAFFLGVGIRNQTLSASKTVRLNEDLPRLAYPAAWRPHTTDPQIFAAFNPGSPSTFDARLEVLARPLEVGESLEKARAGRALQLLTGLNGYRELAAEAMQVYRGQPALVTTYAYIADPTRDSGADGLPVVVEAQDVMFLDNGQFMVVTVAADASEWEAEQRHFNTILASLRLQPAEETPAVSTPGAAETSAHGGEPGLGDVVAPAVTPGSFGSGQQKGQEGGN